MYRYEDCQRCGSVDGERIFDVNQLDVWAYLCHECYELCKHDFKQSISQPERSKREDSIPEQARKEFKQFLDETFDRRMEIVKELQKERDAVL